ncbi:carbohydrate ABC transporter permease [Ruania alba]|uniref:Carbohydrate ABC transporter membrane protein 1, CUT1 family n=1 Tax=Ruania alba TaxID=648782 RepID=A0A1H5BE69_9MICO|nr:sugar ABC transporter permease [Ruania alba]SED52334.1 carbohydrate ABC transporter membrane protein 1, CUT1 family [Ruania alba]
MTTSAAPPGYRAPRRLGGGSRPDNSRQIAARERGRTLSATAFLAPALAVIIAFVFVPAFSALRLSFTDASGFGEESWIGLDNYVTVFTDPATLRAIWNTMLYAVMYGPLVIAVGLAAALLLNRKDVPLRGFFRTVIFLPFVISMAVASLAWAFLLDPNLGLIPYWLGGLGISMGDIFASTTWALPAVTAVAIWKNFGYFMVIFLAGLQGIPRYLYEAAILDGAGAWRQFLAVTVPGLRATMTFVIVFAIIGAFQAFDQIYIMTQGGPDRATETIVYRIYTDGFRDFRMGFASALSYVLLAITLALGLIQLRIGTKREKDLE